MRDFSIAIAARRLGVSPHYLRLLERQGRVPPARRIPGARVYNEQEVDYLRALGVGGGLRRLRRVEDVQVGDR